MASKSKQARQKAALKSKKSILPVILWSLVAALVGYLQNRYGQFSDIRGFYGFRFFDGNNQWPYDSYIPEGKADPLNPIEYPAVTGMILWLLTFITPENGNPIHNYFIINAVFNSALFAGMAFYIRKLSSDKSTYLFIFAPAVVMALNLNWDLWAMLPLVAAVYFFEKDKKHLSAFLLGFSIAVKFFPIVMLLPIAIIYARNRELVPFIKYGIITSTTWFIFNLPVMLASFEGWKYFYVFSFQRGLGEGSFFTIFSKLGLPITFNAISYYLLNIAVFSLVIMFSLKYKGRLNLAIIAYLTMFAFTLFGKQYSMQYVLWLTPFAVIAIFTLSKARRDIATLIFIAWQVTEWGFRYAYFQNMVTNVFIGRGTPIENPITDFQYGSMAAIRYTAIIVFTSYLALSLWRDSQQDKSTINK